MSNRCFCSRFERLTKISEIKVCCRFQFHIHFILKPFFFNLNISFSIYWKRFPCTMATCYRKNWSQLWCSYFEHVTCNAPTRAMARNLAPFYMHSISISFYWLRFITSKFISARDFKRFNRVRGTAPLPLPRPIHFT